MDFKGQLPDGRRREVLPVHAPRRLQPHVAALRGFARSDRRSRPEHPRLRVPRVRPSQTHPLRRWTSVLCCCVAGHGLAPRRLAPPPRHHARMHRPGCSRSRTVASNDSTARSSAKLNQPPTTSSSKGDSIPTAAFTTSRGLMRRSSSPRPRRCIDALFAATPGRCSRVKRLCIGSEPIGAGRSHGIAIACSSARRSRTSTSTFGLPRASAGRCTLDASASAS